MSLFKKADPFADAPELLVKSFEQMDRADFSYDEGTPSDDVDFLVAVKVLTKDDALAALADGATIRFILPGKCFDEATISAAPALTDTQAGVWRMSKLSTQSVLRAEYVGPLYPGGGELHGDFTEHVCVKFDWSLDTPLATPAPGGAVSDL
jgi:hypothetical protein